MSFLLFSVYVYLLLRHCVNCRNISLQFYFNLLLNVRLYYTFSFDMLFGFSGGGIWAIYPAVVSLGYIYGSATILIAIILSIFALSTFILSAFRSAGAPPNILWGSYPAVTKGALENYRFCEYCAKPKSPRAHHCRSCGMCVLDMDHHCPFVSSLYSFTLWRSCLFSRMLCL